MQSVVVLLRTTHTTESARHAEFAMLVIIERMAFDTALLDKHFDILVSPFEDGKEHRNVVLLVAIVDATYLRFAVHLRTLDAFRTSNALYGYV